MVGKQIAHFEVTGRLGQGGMGVVYEAIDQHLKRRVALKVLHPDKTADLPRKERFIQEARAASALNHPNIVTIYDINSAAGVDYIAMELVSGPTLQDLLTRRRLKVSETLRYAVELAGALAAAHAAGIVHRDLKPANIMIAETGLVKILDFGVAKLTDHSVSADARTQTDRVVTDDGVAVGTPSYMSPEQAEGSRIDARSDIFSFGLVLYEMLSGRPAFREETRMATMAAILNKEPAPLGQLVPGLPKELERIVARCLRKDLARRSQSIAEVRLELEELREESESGGSPSVAPTARRLEKRGRRSALAAGAIVIVVIVAGASLLAPWWREARAPLNEVPLTSYPGYQDQPTFAPDGNQFAFIWDGGQEQGPRQLYVSLVGQGPPLQLTHSPADVNHPAWSPGGQTIAFVRQIAGTYHGELILIPALGGPERRLAEGLWWNSRIAWSPDGKWLYFEEPVSPQTRAIFVISSGGGEKHRVTDPPAEVYGDSHPAVSPDGRRFVFVRSFADWNSDLFVVDLEQPTVAGAPKRLTSDRGTKSWPVWSADGKDILFIGGESLSSQRVYRVTASGGTPSPVPLVGGEYATSLAIAPAGHRLAYGRAYLDYNMYRRALPAVDSPAGPPIKFLSSTRFEESPTFSPTTGRRVVFSSNRNGVRQIFVADADGSNTVQLTTFTAGVAGSPDWSPDGRTIAFDARPEALSDIYTLSADGGTPKRLTDHSAEDHLPCYSVDGRWIYFSSTRVGERRLFRMPPVGGEAVEITHKGAVNCQASPDGEWIYYSKTGLGGLWKIPVNGGDEVPVIAPGTMRDAWSFVVTRSGIYYAGATAAAPGITPLYFYRFADGKTLELWRFDRPLRLHFSVSPDERWFAWTQLDSEVRSVVLVENFH